MAWSASPRVTALNDGRSSILFPSRGPGSSLVARRGRGTMRSMVEGAAARAELRSAPSTAFGGPPPPLCGGGSRWRLCSK